MLSTDLYVAEQTMYMRAEERLRQATARGLARRTGSHGTRLSLQLRCQLGSNLVALGRRLQQAGSPQVRPLEGRMSEGH